MVVLVTYDVVTEDSAGRRRLRRVAKVCQNYGQRVQNSVFECIVEPAQFVSMKAKLSQEADLEKDSIRFYRLGANGMNRVEHIGAKPTFNLAEDTLLL